MQFENNILDVVEELNKNKYIWWMRNIFDSSYFCQRLKLHFQKDD